MSDINQSAINQSAVSQTETSQTETNQSDINQPKLNPYIHGTTSAILDLLPLTDFKLNDAISLIETYNIAVMSGEITGGGYDSVNCRCMPCFGRIMETDCNSYNLEKILRYTPHSRINKLVDPINDLKHQLSFARKYGYSNINVIIIFAARCQQLGHDISHLITPELVTDIKKVWSVYSTLLFFGNWLKNVKDNNDETNESIYQNFTYDKLASKIKHDYFTIYEQFKDRNELSEEHKKDLLELFTLPQSDKVVVNPFTFEDSINDSKYNSYEARYISYRLPQNLSSYSINNLLEHYAQNKVDNHFWPEFRRLMYKKIKKLNHRVELLENLMKRTNIPIVKHNKITYPLILLCDDSSTMESLRYEYRATRALKIGEDIKYIATDTEENRLHLEQYIKQHNLKCKTLLFNQLKFPFDFDKIENSQNETKDTTKDTLQDNAFYQCTIV